MMAGAAAAIHAVYGPQGIHIDHYEGIPRLSVATADTSYANVRASFSPIRHSNRAPGRFEGSRFWPFAREGIFSVCANWYRLYLEIVNECKQRKEKSHESVSRVNIVSSEPQERDFDEKC